ncbi:uncharacterized protein LOC9322098 isoform X2 [Arabidopsis lyrata subsp. lyrata]|uniref:uncharacterized protein LOC9322098 isoform X2 n=1 Tax=Arabidopsis lyrata subsp. lyrata TaxID=81972 RepID=UPI000A29D082|nr:uncharacterized protein LOC9322098 isoform X2 [Arabidopsis lyrata subsp. lyrata]|eukprot:XP_020886132.1 uncharacterized protein LOC9322098 isoform X2 [Arabidopsis lyrata subsp. lyrata]
MEAVPPINKCSGTDELASWFCSECDISGKGFETCFRHLKSHALEEEEAIDATLSECHERYNEVVVDGVPDSLDYHLEQQWMTDDYHAGVTAVLWDIKRCPVPPDCDARLVGPCITEYFEDLGYSGPINIYAFGQLTDVPDDVLRAVSSTGISLNHITFNSADIMHLMACWTCLNPRPATIMFICPYSKVSKNDMNHLEEKWGCHVIKQFTYDSPGSQSYFGNFLRLEDDSGTLAEDKCSETGEHASCACLVCNISGKGFENFTMHLKTHALEEEETLAEHFGHVHIVATPSVCHERHYKEVVEAGVEEASLDSHPENATTMVKKQQ